MPDEKDQTTEPEWPTEGPSPSEGEMACEQSDGTMDKMVARIGGGMRDITSIRPRAISQYEQLLALRKSLNEKMAEVNAAIKALEDNPQIERVFRLVSRALY